jgi:hypothetical protein
MWCKKALLVAKFVRYFGKFLNAKRRPAPLIAKQHPSANGQFALELVEREFSPAAEVYLDKWLTVAGDAQIYSKHVIATGLSVQSTAWSLGSNDGLRAPKRVVGGLKPGAVALM